MLEYQHHKQKQYLWLCEKRMSFQIVATKHDLAEMKFELLKWMVVLLIGQTGLLLALLKFFPAAS
jgi:hypothetical protein